MSCDGWNQFTPTPVFFVSTSHAICWTTILLSEHISSVVTPDVSLPGEETMAGDDRILFGTAHVAGLTCCGAVVQKCVVGPPLPRTTHCRWRIDYFAQCSGAETINGLVREKINQESFALRKK